MEEFDAVIQEGSGGGAMIEVPFDAKEVFGPGRPRVVASFDGAPYRGSIASMGGRHLLGVTKAIRAAIGKGPGDTIHVTVAADTAPRVVEVPGDLAAALAGAGLRDAFDSLSYTRRKEHARSIEGAKKAETRARRIQAAIDELHG